MSNNEDQVIYKAAAPPSLAGRYETVIMTLLKYGFADILAHPPFQRFLPKSGRFIPKVNGKTVTDYTRYERIRMVCEELGTTFIKFAQIASNRPDLLPESLISELEGLQDHAPLVPIEFIHYVIEKSLGLPPETCFAVFDEIPVASASMAQVHRAVLHDGREVAVKILRPGIKEVVAMDIRILKQLAELIEDHFPAYQSFQPLALVDMFETSIQKECHFRLEANNLLKFNANFKDHPDIHVPFLVPEFCSDDVICMEFIHGFKITDLEKATQIGIEGKALALKGIGLYFEQVFRYGFFHADPHPGNVFVMADQRICFVDYGMMGTVLEADKIRLANLLISIADRDVDRLKKALLRFGNIENISSELEKSMEYDLTDFLNSYESLALRDIDGQEVMAGVNRLFYTYKIKVPPHLLLLLKALVIIEGVGLKLDPEYNIIENITPFVRRLLAERFQPARLGRQFLRTSLDVMNMAGRFPGDVTEVLRKLKKGNLHIKFEHTGLEALLLEMDKASNRIAFALVIAALIMGSSLIVIARIPPFIYNISSLGFIGFVISALLALRLAYAILKQGKI
jgi:ubiquinone biosynthesis protein